MLLMVILSKLYPTADKKEGVSKYQKYENNINMCNTEYPVKIKDIPKLKIIKKNHNLNINVFALNKPDDTNSLYTIDTSTEHRQIDAQSPRNTIDLLYLEQDGNTHYCLIKVLNSFLSTPKHTHLQKLYEYI